MYKVTCYHEEECKDITCIKHCGTSFEVSTINQAETLRNIHVTNTNHIVEIVNL